jgi:hypothetical protein
MGKAYSTIVEERNTCRILVGNHKEDQYRRMNNIDIGLRGGMGWYELM